MQNWVFIGHHCIGHHHFLHLLSLTILLHVWGFHSIAALHRPPPPPPPPPHHLPISSFPISISATPPPPPPRNPPHFLPLFSSLIAFVIPSSVLKTTSWCTSGLWGTFVWLCKGIAKMVGCLGTSVASDYSSMRALLVDSPCVWDLRQCPARAATSALGCGIFCCLLGGEEEVGLRQEEAKCGGFGTKHGTA